MTVRSRLAFVALLGAGSALACTHAGASLDVQPVPASAARPVAELPAAPRAAPDTARPVAELPDNWQELAARLTLGDVVDIALERNDATRAAWQRARSAAARVGQERSDLWPGVGLSLGASKTQQSALGGQFKFQQGTWSPAADLAWLLWDFGGRSARISEAEARLLAADWQHDATLQAVVLGVEEAYFRYLAARAEHDAAEATVREATVGLEAATRRREVGVATVADVLQAKTVLSQAELQRRTFAGQIEILRGSLATAMGIPANIPFEVGELPSELPAVEVAAAVEPLIERALAERPDLATLRWQAEQSARHLAAVRAEGRPEITLSGTANRTFYWAPESISGSAANNWSAGIALRFPLFTGFDHTFRVRQAEADAAAAGADARSYEQQVVLDVWTALAELKTAAQRMETSRDLLGSATESERVALALYREGVGSILDLLTAQVALASARSQEIEARTDWLLGIAHLAYATGSLGPAIPTLDEVAGRLGTSAPESEQP